MMSHRLSTLLAAPEFDGLAGCGVWEKVRRCERPAILIASMSETTRTETQLGIADLTKRFSAAGIAVIAQRINPLPQRSIYFEIGNTEHQTVITLPINFLDDLPNTKEYQAAVDSYALAVAGRLKCGSPEVFYCRSGVAVRVSTFDDEHSAIDGLVHEISLRHIRFIGAALR